MGKTYVFCDRVIDLGVPIIDVVSGPVVLSIYFPLNLRLPVLLDTS
jgi:hypothetical protein